MSIVDVIIYPQQKLRIDICYLLVKKVYER